MATTVMCVLGAGSAVFRFPLSGLFASDPQVVTELATFILMLAVAQPFMGVHFTLAGALRGAGDTLTPMWGAAAGTWLLRVPLAALAAFVFEWPVTVVWLALVGDHVVRSLWVGVEFSKGRWRDSVGAEVQRGAQGRLPSETLDDSAPDVV